MPGDNSTTLSPSVASNGMARFNAAWWLANRHLQSCYGPLFRRNRQSWETAERIDTPDGDFVTLCMTHGQPDTPIVLLLHGLEGCRDSHYIAGLAAQTLRRGWTSAVFEQRSCSPELNLTPQLYHLGWTQDAAFIIGLLAERYPRRFIAAIGCSLGANVLLKWMGENPSEAGSRLFGAVAISAPFDIAASEPLLTRGMGLLYTRYFMRRLLPKAHAKARQFPGLFDVTRLDSCRTLRDFDSCVTAPVHGFANADAYYQQSSCGPHLPEIRVPTLLISAEDDPMHLKSCLPHEVVEESSYLYGRFSPRGGHVGFITGGLGSARYWAEEQALDFLEHHAPQE